MNPTEHSPPDGFLSKALAWAGLSPEVFIWRPSEEIPEPFRALLVHKGDMTSTLERFHQERMLLEVLAEKHSNECYHREVILRGEGTGRAAEFGLIEIELDNFSCDLQKLILRGEQPLGGILNQNGISYKSQPLGYFSVAREALPTKLSLMGSARLFFGRFNQLECQKDACLARILEIVPDFHHS